MTNDAIYKIGQPERKAAGLFVPFLNMSTWIGNGLFIPKLFFGSLLATLTKWLYDYEAFDFHIPQDNKYSALFKVASPDGYLFFYIYLVCPGYKTFIASLNEDDVKRLCKALMEYSE